MSHREIEEIAPGVWLGVPAPGEGAMGAVAGEHLTLYIDTTSYPPFASRFVETVEARALRLADQSAVEKLQRTYGYFVDQGLWNDVAELFAPDGSLEIGGRGVFLGRERAREYLIKAFGEPGRRDGLLIDHQQFQGIVTIGADGQSARGRWTAFVMGAGGCTA